MDWFRSWQFFALYSALFAGLTAFLGKKGVANINSNIATLIRTGVVLIIAAVIVTWFCQWPRWREITPKTWVFLSLSGVTTALSWLCYYRAIQLGPVSKVASIDKLSVVVAILLCVFFLAERLSWQVIVGGGLITVGAIILSIFS